MTMVHSTDIVGFAYNADVHCPDCAGAAGMDLVGARDSEGNEPTPVFAGAEFDCPQVCGACFAEIEYIAVLEPETDSAPASLDDCVNFARVRDIYVSDVIKRLAHNPNGVGNSDRAQVRGFADRFEVDDPQIARTVRTMAPVRHFCEATGTWYEGAEERVFGGTVDTAAGPVGLVAFARDGEEAAAKFRTYFVQNLVPPTWPSDDPDIFVIDPCPLARQTERFHAHIRLRLGGAAVTCLIDSDLGEGAISCAPLVSRQIHSQHCFWD